VAYRDDLSEPTEVFHNNIRDRFERKETKVVNAMRYWAGLAGKARKLLLNRQDDKIGPLLNANFDRRRKIYKISKENIQMVETARSTGATAKFTGSGGAIVGTCENERMLNQLKKKLKSLKIKVITPKIVGGNTED
jgi:glucuronokinase